MRKVLLIAVVIALGAGSTACATKKYVNSQVGDVNDKVTTLGSQVEATQERVRTAETRIGEVDAKASTAGQRADAAGRSADAAGRSAEEARAAATVVDGRVTEMDKASKRLVYQVVLSDDKNKFASGRATLAAGVKAELDKVVEALAADPKNVYLEIEGHTDAVGSPALNERLGLQRAEAVKKYLYEQHSVPLHKMNVISFGEAKPVAPNNTRVGRSQNRRVVIKVLT